MSGRGFFDSRVTLGRMRGWRAVRGRLVPRRRGATVLLVPVAVTVAVVALAATVAGVLTWSDVLAPDDGSRAAAVRVTPTPTPTIHWPDPVTEPRAYRELQRLAAERSCTFFGRALSSAPTIPPGICPSLPPPLPPDAGSYRAR